MQRVVKAGAVIVAAVALVVGAVSWLNGSNGSEVGLNCGSDRLTGTQLDVLGGGAVKPTTIDDVADWAMANWFPGFPYESGHLGDPASPITVVTNQSGEPTALFVTEDGHRRASIEVTRNLGSLTTTAYLACSGFVDDYGPPTRGATESTPCTQADNALVCP